jgi:hypothetical protein
VTDPAPATIRIYGELRQRLPGVTFVPLHNETIKVLFEKEDFPATRRECSVIQLPRLVADRARRDRSAELLVRRLHGLTALRADRSPPMDRPDLHRVPRP